MSTITFKALINDIHYDPKKGTLKIQLLADNYVSLDKLATLGPHDENVKVTLESAQTKITEAKDPIAGPIRLCEAIDEKGAPWLEEAARKLGESEKTSDKEDDPEDKNPTEGGGDSDDQRSQRS
jgi:hypothetical protein